MGLFKTEINQEEAVRLVLRKLEKIEDRLDTIERAYSLKIPILEMQFNEVHKEFFELLEKMYKFETRAKEAVGDIAKEAKFFHEVINDLYNEKVPKKKRQT